MTNNSFSKAYGEGNTEVSLTAQIEGEEAVEEVQYTVEAQKYDAEEVKWLFQEAYENCRDTHE